MLSTRRQALDARRLARCGVDQSHTSGWAAAAWIRPQPSCRPPATPGTSAIRRTRRWHARVMKVKNHTQHVFCCHRSQHPEVVRAYDFRMLALLYTSFATYGVSLGRGCLFRTRALAVTKKVIRKCRRYLYIKTSHFVSRRRGTSLRCGAQCVGSRQWRRAAIFCVCRHCMFSIPATSCARLVFPCTRLLPGTHTSPRDISCDAIVISDCDATRGERTGVVRRAFAPYVPSSYLRPLRALLRLTTTSPPRRRIRHRSHRGHRSRRRFRLAIRWEGQALDGREPAR